MTARPRPGVADRRAMSRSSSRGRGWRTDPEATAAGVRKQAMVPDGATVLEPVGTAPGLVVPVAEGRSGPPVVVLPGPPSELQPMWPDALATPVVQEALGGAVELRQRPMRLWGVPESQLSATMRGLDLADLEITTCLRDGELEIVTRYGPEAQSGYDAFVSAWSTSTARPLARPTAGRSTTSCRHAAGARLDDRDRRVVHGRAAGRPADRAGRLLGVRPGRAGRLLQPGQARPRRRRQPG